MKKISIGYLLLAIALLPLASQTDEGLLFGDENASVIHVTVDQNTDLNQSNTIYFSEEPVKIGGSFESDLRQYVMYQHNPWEPEGFSLDRFYNDAYEAPLTALLRGSIYVDARPEKDFRFFAKFKTAYPFELTSTYNYLQPNPTDPLNPLKDNRFATLSIDKLNLTIWELYTDFNWDEKLFFRFGKHTIKWGVGYFVSPADVLNLTPIDIEKPTQEREGPISLRLNMPFDAHNLYLYLIYNSGIDRYDELAIAPKAEFVLGNTELGVGGYYQKDLSPKIMATFSTTVFNIGFFGEGVASYGTERKYVVHDENGTPSVKVKDDQWLFTGTIGFNYLNSEFNIMAIGQYYFNQAGYDDRDQAAFVHENKDSKILALVYQKQLSINDLMWTGQHYFIGILSFTKLFCDDLSFSALWRTNLSDLSGIVTPVLTYKPLDFLSISAGCNFVYGKDNDEMVKSLASNMIAPMISGGRFNAYIGVNIGTGKF